MAAIGSDGLSLRIGDGAVSETFYVLNGVSLKRMEITQRVHAATAISANAWQQQAGVSDRKLAIEIEAFAMDDAASLRLRELALAGEAGNIQLNVSSAETISTSVYLTRYDERIEPGTPKRMSCRLESSGLVIVTG